MIPELQIGELLCWAAILHRVSLWKRRTEVVLKERRLWKLVVGMVVVLRVSERLP